MHDQRLPSIPASFLALYQDARGRATVPAATLAERHDLCEDLAQQLTDTARRLHHDLHVERDEVLAELRAGLSSDRSGLSAAEAGWVVTRLAELMDWLPRSTT